MTARTPLRPTRLVVALALALPLWPAHADIGFLATRIDAPGGIGGTTGTALNRHGQVVGFLASGDAFSFSDGVLNVLPRLNGSTMLALDVDDSGRILGRTGNASAVTASQQVVRWQPATSRQAGAAFGAPERLGPATTLSAALRADGLAVGGGLHPDLQLLREDGTAVVVGTTASGRFDVQDVNAGARVVGALVSPVGRGDAFVRDATGVHLLPRLAGVVGPSQARAINDQNRIVGNIGTQAVVWGPGGQLTDLGSRINGFGGVGAANAVANTGHVVGAMAANGQQGAEARAFLWSERSGLRPLGEGRAVAINDLGQVLVNHNGTASLLTPSGRLFFTAGNALFSDAAAWVDTAPGAKSDTELGLAPSRLLDATLMSSLPGETARDHRARVAQDVTVKSLRIGQFGGASGPGAGNATLLFTPQTTLPRPTLTALEGVVVRDGGRISGSGRIVGGVVVEGPAPGQSATAVGGAVQVFDLGVSGGPLVNRGLVHSAVPDARLQADLHNQAGGLVEVLDGRSLTLLGDAHRNAGMVNVTAAQLQVAGVFVNEAGGRVNVTLAGRVTFADAVLNNGAFFVENDAVVRFNGLVGGSGQFQGGFNPERLVFAGGFNPGNSPADVQLDGASFEGGEIVMDLAGFAPGSQHDRLRFGGAVRFSGGTRLLLRMDEQLQVHAGDRFDLFDWGGGVQGALDLSALPVLGDGLQWDRSQVHTSGVLAVAAVPEPQTALLLAGGLGLLAWRARRAGRLARA